MPARLEKQGHPWKALCQRDSRIFFWGKSRQFEAQISRTSEIPSSKNPIFMASPVDTQTHGGQAAQEGPPSTQENLSLWADARASPLQLATSLLCQAREKWSTSSLFQPPHWSGMRFWGHHLSTFRAIFPLWEPSLVPAGVPPFWVSFWHKIAAKFRAQGAVIRRTDGHARAGKSCPWRALEQRSSHNFSWAQTRSFGAPSAKSSDFPGSKKPGFLGVLG